MQKIVKIMGVEFCELCVVEEWGLYYRMIVPPARAGTEWRDWVGVKCPVSNSIIGTQNCRLQCGHDSINADTQAITHVDVSMVGKSCVEYVVNGGMKRSAHGKDTVSFADVWAVGLSSCRTTITTPTPSPYSSPA